MDPWTHDMLATLDHEWFGSFLDAGPGEYDKLETDGARVSYLLSAIQGFRRSIGMID